MTETKSLLYQRIYNVVRQIPSGQVASYGQIGQLAGCTAREVGYAMAAVKEDDIPWQRVINAQGKISLSGDSGDKQRELLEQEGVQFDAKAKVDFNEYGWLGPW